MPESLTHKDLSTLLGVSETTIKSYRHKFPGCIPVANKGKPIRFTPEAGAICLRIRDLFGTGMSVPEVRARLVEEFSWIRKEEKSTKVVVKSVQGIESIESASASGHMQSNLNNLAKSMVSLHQQQSAMLKSLNNIERLLAGGLPAGTIAELAASVRAEAPVHALREDKLLKMMQQTEELAKDLGAVGRHLAGALEETNALQRNWAAGALALENRLEKKAMGQSMAQGAGSEPGKDESDYLPGSNATPLRLGREGASGGVASSGPGKLDDLGASGHGSVTPPRQFLSLPLIVRNAEGAYISLGGSRGTLSLNDLKAILAQAFLPPEDYSMHWRQTPQGWWLDMEQSYISENNMRTGERSRKFKLLLVEQVSARGIAALEVAQLLENDNLTHPVELCAFINNI